MRISCLLKVLFCTALPLFLPCTCVSAQSTDSTLLIATAPLTTVSVYGTPYSEPVAASVSTVLSDDLARYDRSSPLAALNLLPGVRFERRATASYRLAIRGASLRAPFGVRNTQLYWNGLPLSEPGGDVPLNFLDAINIDRIDVLRGPSGGFYGPGTAGTLLLNTDLPTLEAGSIAGSLTAGSYGYLRGDLNLTTRNPRQDVQQLRLGYQRTDGFREHSAMERFTAQYSAFINQKTHFHALYTKLFYELPGGLNAEQYAEDPRQARPGSVDKNASINYHNLLIGATRKQHFKSWTVESALYATAFYFDHPFNFDYKRETNLGTGARLFFRRLLGDKLELLLGVEQKLQMRFGNNFSNPDGTRPGNLNFSDEIYSAERLLATQLHYQPGPWDLTVGLSNSHLRYTVDRTFDTEENAAKTEFFADQPFSIRAAIGRRIGAKHYLYLSRADGFSPPSLDEFRTNEGSLNTELDPEIGTNYELGYRFEHAPWSLNATAFHFRLTEAITSYASERGTQLFRNSGATTQNGLELSARHQTALTPSLDLTTVATYTYYDFKYDELERNGQNFTGKRIPGAAPHSTNLEARLTHKHRLSLSLRHSFVDAIPLNDANDVFAQSYHLLRAGVSYDFGRFTIFAAGSNLLDERMSFGNDLNPMFGGRYFQPAPGRNWQIGVRGAFVRG